MVWTVLTGTREMAMELKTCPAMEKRLMMQVALIVDRLGILMPRECMSE
jgi:hypothetical protein